MARVPGADAIYELAEQFRQQCLTTGNSLLWPNDKVWTVENVTQLRAAFDKPVQASNFYAKLKLQLADCPPAVHKVAVDAYAFYQLPVAVPTTAEYKLARIREIIDCKLSNDQPDQTLLVKAFTEEWDHGNRLAPGLMNPGRFYL